MTADTAVVAIKTIVVVRNTCAKFLMFARALFNTFMSKLLPKRKGYWIVNRFKEPSLSQYNKESLR